MSQDPAPYGDPPLTKIYGRVVSGGQTGADQGGLDAALALIPLRSGLDANSFPEPLGSPRILAVPTEWAQTLRLLPVGAST